MTLVVDIGNAQIKWALVKNGALCEPGEALHVVSIEEAFGALAQALPEEMTRVLAANVAGEVLASRLVTFAMDRWGVEPEFLEPVEEQLGIRCAYEHPARLGADRWAAIIAAYHLASGAACVIDAGTAVTLDAVDGGGQHLGGLIMAGPRIVATALHCATDGIGMAIDGARAPTGAALLGRNTSEAVARGAMLGLAAALDRAFTVMTEEMSGEPKVYLTGGDGELLLPWMEAEPEYRANLVLEGLALVAAAG